MPSSLAVSRALSSISRLNSDHSIWMAASGCVAWARRICSLVASLTPRWRIFPAATASAIAPMDSSTGTLGSTRCR